MGTRYRNWDELRQIIRAAIAESDPPPLASFNLSPNEEIFFRTRAARAVQRLARQCSGFKAYYVMPTEKPFARVVVLSMIVIAFSIVAGIEVFLTTRETPAYPIFAALLTIASVAAGWSVVGGIAHRNTVRQNTNTLLFARFSQAPFVEAMHRFHHQFKYGLQSRVTRAHLVELRDSGDDEKLKNAASVAYILNYFEFVAAGVLRGDLDQSIIEANIRGVLCYYYDKCEPYILDANGANPRIYEHLIKMRLHYREP